MPRIRTFQPNVKLPQPVFSAKSFGGQVGQEIANIGGEVSELGRKVDAFQTQRQISKLNAEAARARAELTNEWREQIRTADPNDQETASRFMNERVKPRLAEIGGLATTRQAKSYFEKLSAGLDADFSTRTFAGQQGLVEVAEVQNAQTMINQMSSSVANDPASFETSATLSQVMLEGMVENGGLSREDSLKLLPKMREENARAAIRGLIAQNPVAAIQDIDGGRFNEFISGEDRLRFKAQAEAAQAALEREASQQRDDAAKQAGGEFLENLIDPETGKVRVTNQMLIDLVEDERFDTPEGRDDQRIFFNLARSIAQQDGERTIKTNPAVFQTLWDGAGLEPGDPNRPTRQDVLNQVGRGLTIQDSKNILTRLEDGFTPEGGIRNRIKTDAFAAARSALRTQKDETFADPEGAQNFSDFRIWAEQEAQRLQDEGKSDVEIWASDGPILSQINTFKRTRQEQRATRKQNRAFQRGQGPAPERSVAEPLEDLRRQQSGEEDLSEAAVDAKARAILGGK